MWLMEISGSICNDIEFLSQNVSFLDRLRHVTDLPNWFSIRGQPCEWMDCVCFKTVEIL
jgi:hypothetical protein